MISPTPPSSRAAALTRLEDKRLRHLMGSVLDLVHKQHGSGRSCTQATALTIHADTVSVTAILLSDLQQTFFPRVSVLDLDAELIAIKRLFACSLLSCNWDQTFLARPLVPDLARDLEAGFWLEAADLIRSSFTSLDDLRRHPFFWDFLRVKDLVMTFGEEMGKLPRPTPASPSTLRADIETIVSGLVGGSSLDWSCMSPVLLRHFGYVPPEGAELEAVLSPFAPRPEAPTEKSPASKYFDGKFNCYLRHDGVRCPLEEHIEAFEGVFRPSPPIQHVCTDACKNKSKCTERSNCRTPPWSFPALAEQLRHALVHCTHWNSFAASDVADVKEVLGVPATSPITDMAVIRWLVWPPAGSSLPAYLAGGQYLMLIVRILRTIKGQPLATYFKGSLAKLES
jgi:hypothetical protein